MVRQQRELKYGGATQRFGSTAEKGAATSGGGKAEGPGLALEDGRGHRHRYNSARDLVGHTSLTGGLKRGAMKSR